MAKISVDINGRKYALGCNEGEQDRLMRLGQKLDERVKNIASAKKSINAVVHVKNTSIVNGKMIFLH